MALTVAIVALLSNSAVAFQMGYRHLDMADLQGRAMGPDDQREESGIHVSMFGPSSPAPPADSARASSQFDPSRDYVLSYTLGKTGSFGLWQAIKDWSKKIAQVSVFPRTEHHPDAARNFLSHIPAGGRTWILVGVRNPYDRFLSAFQERRHYVWDRHPSANVSEEIDLLHSWLAGGCNFDYELEFFPTFKDVTGVDLLSRPVSFAEHHELIDAEVFGRPTRILILRLEDSPHWNSVLQQFFPGVEVGHENSGSDRPGEGVYHHLLGAWRWAPKEARCIWDQSGEMHFYSGHEKEGFRASARMPGEF